MAGGTGDDGGGWIWVLILVGAGIWYFFSASEKVPPTSTQSYLAEPPAISSGKEQPSQKPVEKPAPLPIVKPNYDFAEDGAYGYISAVSEEDRRKGIAVGDVSLFRYLGKSEGLHRLQHVNDAGLVTGNYECASACVAIKAYRNDGSMQRVPYNPGSIIGAAFADAIAGRLKARPRPKPKAPPVVEEEILDVEGPGNNVAG